MTAFDKSVLDELGSKPAIVDGNDSLFGKISWRILPLLFLGYVFSYLDRINIGYAALQMKVDLGFTDAVYGLGAGVFFVSYIVCEIPSNLLLQKIGARLTITRIMICWGLTSCSMIFIDTRESFYAIRILLGIFEAGFSPAAMVYLTLWYPRQRIGQMTALFLSGSTVAGLIGSPISGLIMDHTDQVLGLRSWQWLFLLEGAPTILLGIAAFFIMAEKPENAPWLSSDEKRSLTEQLPPTSNPQSGGSRDALRDLNVYAVGLVWFTVACGIYAVAFWMPMMLRSAGVQTASSIGLWSIVPYGASAIGMILVSRRSDRMAERRWHAATCTFVGAIALALIPQAGRNPAIAVLAISIASVAMFAAAPILLAIPMTVLSVGAAPVGIALVNSIGVTGGFISPFMLGWVKTATGDLNNGLYVVAGALVIGTIIILRIIKLPQQRDL